MYDFPQLHLGTFIAAFAVYFILIGVTSSFLLSRLGGWGSLAKRYRTARALPAHRRSFQRGQMRSLISYSVLTTASDAEGLYLSILLLTRLGHPHLFVPWAEIEVEAPQRKFFSNVQTLLLGPERIPLRLRESLVDFLLAGKGASEQRIDEQPNPKTI